jgi:5-methylcytosine-specific restriction endonuclease McrBC GTP-binding regulatory subunit McrB
MTNYWVVSPNVNNDETLLDKWIATIRNTQCAFMGWSYDVSRGRTFCNDVQVGDVILIAMRGIQVSGQGDKIKYENVQRIFSAMCKAAERDIKNNYVLIIDEINRAPIAAVLGELIYGLEYRNAKIATPYAIDDDDTLSVPGNLYIIGTMNTADRSIGHIGYAVRRRFAFVSCGPELDVLSGYYRDNPTGPKAIAENLFEK